MELLGVAYVDVRARVTNFDRELRAGVRASMVGASGEFATGSRLMQAEAGRMEATMVGRFGHLAERSGLSAFGAEMAKLGKVVGLTLGVALPAAAIIATVEFSKMAGDLQSKMQLLVTAAGEAQGNIAGMTKGLLENARLTGTSVGELADGLYIVEKAGYRTSEAMQVLRIASEGARAEGAKLSTVAAALTSVMQSYHIPAAQAALVMNEIVVAAGESKTTMEAFAGSLSTVVPVAQAAGIRFAEVGAAIATLTQHGTTANEATQELANVIRNLQAPNQIAAASMQQLGINVVALQQGLSDPKIGLIGSIESVVKSIGQHMGPSGLVMVDAFNQSKSAAQDAAIIFSKLPKPVQDIAQKFNDGTITQLQWRKSLLELTPTQANLARQFADVSNRADGFNRLLRSGSPAATTYAAALKTAFGGSTGLNAVLQLTGDSLPGLLARLKAIDKGAVDTGKDIATWGSVQKSFNVQMGQFKEAIVTNGISIATKLLPYITGAASATLNWFKHLGDGGSVFANLQDKFGPFAGAVGLIHSAFVVTANFVTKTFIPAVLAVWHGLQPLIEAMQRGASTALHFAHEALGGLATVLRDVIAPVLGFLSKGFSDNAKAFADAAVGAFKIALALGTLGAAATLVKFAMDALISRRLAIELGLQLTVFGSLAAKLLAFGKAIYVVQGAQLIAAAATKAWALAEAGFLVVTNYLRGTALVGWIYSVVASTGLGTAATWLWAAATTALSAAFRLLTATPIGLALTVVAAAALAVITIMEKGSNVSRALGEVWKGLTDAFSAAGRVLKDLGDVLGYIFSLDGKKLLHSLADLGKGLLSLTVGPFIAVGKAVASLFGADFTKKITITLNADALKGIDKAFADMNKSVSANVGNLYNTLSHSSFTDYSGSIDTAISKLKDLKKPIDDVKNATGGAKVIIDGVSYSEKAWTKALEETGGNMIDAAALIRNSTSLSGKYDDQINTLTVRQQKFSDVLQKSADHFQISTAAAESYAALMGVTADAVGRGAVGQDAFNTAVANGQYIVNHASDAVINLFGQIQTYNASAKTATDASDLFRAALDALTGQVQPVTTAIGNVTLSVHDLIDKISGVAPNAKDAATGTAALAAGLFNGKGDIDAYSVAGANLANDMETLHTKLKDAALSQFNLNLKTQDAPTAAANAAKAYTDLANGAIAQIAASGNFSAAQIKAMHTAIDVVPGFKEFLMSLPGVKDGTIDVGKLGTAIGGLPPGKNLPITVTGNGLTVVQNIADILAHQIVDKQITITTYSNILPGTSNVPAIPGASSQSHPAYGGLFRSFAMGGWGPQGGEDHIAQVANGSYRLWAEPETGGEAYIPLASDRRDRSTSILGWVARYFGGRFLTHEQLRDAGLAMSMGGVLGRGSSYASGGNSALNNLVIKIEHSDIVALQQALGGTVKQIQSKANILSVDVAKVQASGGPASLVAIVNSDNQQILALATKRSGISDKLTAANAKLVAAQKLFNTESKRVSDAIKGQFDIAQVGNYSGYSSVESITQGLQNKVNAFNKFSANLSRVESLGLSKDLVAKLAEGGPDQGGANASALAGATKAQIAQINLLYKNVNAGANKIGDAAANNLYGAGVNAAQGLVDGIKSQVGAITAQMTGIANAMAAAIKRALGIHSPSSVGHAIGSYFGQGIVNGLDASHDSVRRSSAALARTAVRGAEHSSGASAGVATAGVVNHIYAAPGMTTDMLVARVSAVQSRQIRYNAPVSPGYREPQRDNVSAIR